MLRDLASKHNIYIGTALSSAISDRSAPDWSNYTNTAAQQFNLLTPENEMKWGATEPQRNQFNFGQGDAILAFGQQHQQIVRGHNLAWGAGNPGWLTNGNFNASALNSILQNHIKNVVSHYKGKLYCWDVVNEAVSDSGPTNELKHNVWYPAIPNYIDLAHQWAREADPNVKLFYNDYSAEGMNSKSNAIYNMVKSMKQRGIPIDGVGLQMHISTTGYPSPDDVKANIQRLGALGLEVHITEMDVAVSGSGADQEAQQAKVYSLILEACLSQPNCKNFEVWGFTDKHSWIAQKQGDIFSANYVPKPAFNSLAQNLA
jgi:endo-1,4-beta-xylanase